MDLNTKISNVLNSSQSFHSQCVFFKMLDFTWFSALPRPHCVSSRANKGKMSAYTQAQTASEICNWLIAHRHLFFACFFCVHENFHASFQLYLFICSTIYGCIIIILNSGLNGNKPGVHWICPNIGILVKVSILVWSPTLLPHRKTFISLTVEWHCVAGCAQARFVLIRSVLYSLNTAISILLH